MTKQVFSIIVLLLALFRSLIFLSSVHQTFYIRLWVSVIGCYTFVLTLRHIATIFSEPIFNYITLLYMVYFGGCVVVSLCHSIIVLLCCMLCVSKYHSFYIFFGWSSIYSYRCVDTSTYIHTYIHLYYRFSVSFCRLVYTMIYMT